MASARTSTNIATRRAGTTPLMSTPGAQAAKDAEDGLLRVDDAPEWSDEVDDDDRGFWSSRELEAAAAR